MREMSTVALVTGGNRGIGREVCRVSCEAASLAGLAVCRRFRMWFWCPAAAGRTKPREYRLSLPSHSWQAGTVALWQRDGQNRRVATLRRLVRTGPGRRQRPQPPRTRSRAVPVTVNRMTVRLLGLVRFLSLV